MPPVDASAIAVVIVTYRSAAHVGATLSAVAPQLREDDELIVVDNASDDDTVAVAEAASDRVRVLQTGANLGFAGGCNAGAGASSAPLLLFLNPDAVPAPGCIEALRAAAGAHPSWGAWQALVTLPGGASINTSGGVTHFLGLAWTGGYGTPAAAAAEGPVSFASGAALVVRRDAWDRLDGFDERYFMYCEDVDLSLRLWLSGYEVGLAPAALVEHDYEFDKGERKWFLLERNRWWTVLADYPGRLLVLLAPALLAAEIGLLAVAWRGGWLRQKLRANVAVARSLPEIRVRRAAVQSLRTVDAAGFAGVLSARLDNPFLGAAATSKLLARLVGGYWALTRRLLGC